MNVDISTCIHVCRFMKMGNFACIKVRILSITGSLGYYEGNFRGVGLHIFAYIQERRIPPKYIQHENMYVLYLRDPSLITGRLRGGRG